MSTQLDNLRTKAEHCLCVARARSVDDERLLIDIVTLEGWLDAGIGHLRVILRSIRHIEAVA